MKQGKALRAVTFLGALAAVLMPGLGPAMPSRDEPDLQIRPMAHEPVASARDAGCNASHVPSAAATVDAERGAAQVVGQVVDLDPSGGTLTLATRAGTVSLRGTPDALSELEVGDVVVVEVNMMEDEPAREEARCL